MLEIGFLWDDKFERGERREARAAFGQGKTEDMTAMVPVLGNEMDMPACHIQLIHVGREIDTDETARYMFEGKFPLVGFHSDRKRTVWPCLRDFRARFDFFKVAIYAAQADIIFPKRIRLTSSASCSAEKSGALIGKASSSFRKEATAKGERSSSCETSTWPSSSAR